MRLELHRHTYGDKQITGELFVIDDNNDVLDRYYTLERPDKGNKNNISCIPDAEYDLEIFNSKKHPNSFHVIGVPNRKYILLHSGNYYTHSKGCIILGSGLKDINKDGLLDTINSRAAMDSLNKYKDEIKKIMIK